MSDEISNFHFLEQKNGLKCQSQRRVLFPLSLDKLESDRIRKKGGVGIWDISSLLWVNEREDPWIMKHHQTKGITNPFIKLPATVIWLRRSYLGSILLIHWRKPQLIFTICTTKFIIWVVTLSNWAWRSTLVHWHWMVYAKKSFKSFFSKKSCS